MYFNDRTVSQLQSFLVFSVLCLHGNYNAIISQDNKHKDIMCLFSELKCIIHRKKISHYTQYVGDIFKTFVQK